MMIGFLTLDEVAAESSAAIQSIAPILQPWAEHQRCKWTRKTGEISLWVTFYIFLVGTKETRPLVMRVACLIHYVAFMNPSKHVSDC